MKTLQEAKQSFEKNLLAPIKGQLLVFEGCPGYDVYNCSVPFSWQGKQYIFGRVEQPGIWADSRVLLFEATAEVNYQALPQTVLQLEDPFVCQVDGEWVVGGTHVRKQAEQIDTYYTYFYRGPSPFNLHYFTTGPDKMKDVRLLQLPDGIAVFSRPRDETVRQTFGSHAVIGFTKIANLEELTADIIANADIITDVFGQDEWGGCNQCYYLDSGLIGIIGHKSYSSSEDAETADLVYVNVAWIFDPDKHKMLDERILAVRSSYPDATPKRSRLADCAFTSGISPAEGDQVWLYSGLGDAREGRILIPDPFKAFGKVTKWV